MAGTGGTRIANRNPLRAGAVKGRLLDKPQQERDTSEKWTRSRETWHKRHCMFSLFLPRIFFWYLKLARPLGSRQGKGIWVRLYVGVSSFRAQSSAENKS